MFKEKAIRFGTDGKSKLNMKVYRAKTGKLEELPTLWYVKNFIREIGVQFLNLFRKERQYATVLTSVGEAWIVDKLDETLQTTGDFIGWGTGAGTAAKTSVDLFLPAAEIRIVAARSQPLADKIRWAGTLTSATVQTITNAGNFTASTGGTLVIHGDFTGVALAANDAIQFTIEMEVS